MILGNISLKVGGFMKWGVRSMFWYVVILIIAFVISIYYYNQLVNEPGIQVLFFG